MLSIFLHPCKSSVLNLRRIFWPLLTFRPMTQTSLTPTLPSGYISQRAPTFQLRRLQHSITPGSEARERRMDSDLERSGSMGSVSMRPKTLYAPRFDDDLAFRFWPRSFRRASSRRPSLEMSSRSRGWARLFSASFLLNSEISDADIPIARIFTLAFLDVMTSDSESALPLRSSLAEFNDEGQFSRDFKSATVLPFITSKVCVVPLWEIEMDRALELDWAKELMSNFKKLQGVCSTQQRLYLEVHARRGTQCVNSTASRSVQWGSTAR
mmetsp:Transcript_8784/g.15949  ORF Transcript_8784/g.15949 Transcript_8784/m.15949 type:complete len:268 (-) Transcript_8784:37-840(-)